MAYSKSVIEKTRAEFTAKQEEAIRRSEEARARAYSEIEGLREIDTTLATTFANLTIEIAKGESEIEERIGKLKQANLSLQEKRARLLEAHGYPADYTDVKYECPLCSDSGYIGVKMCECLRVALAKNGIAQSGLAHLTQTQSFESFNLDYYRESPKAFAEMTSMLKRARGYAEGFSPDSDNLLFMGKTGLGKTHISTSIARVVIEKGFNVCYETMQNIMSDFEYERFGRSYNSERDEHRTDKYFDCDLLIIDDLGTEMINGFSLACLYNLINTRVINNKKMIISTNVSSKELREKYDERLTSRILGEFDPVVFVGTDVREQKLKGH